MHAVVAVQLRVSNTPSTGSSFETTLCFRSDYNSLWTFCIKSINRPHHMSAISLQIRSIRHVSRMWVCHTSAPSARVTAVGLLAHPDAAAAAWKWVWVLTDGSDPGRVSLHGINVLSLHA